MDKPIAERLFGNVERLPWSGCWIWMGYTDENGRGQIFVQKGMRPQKTHRVSWSLANRRPITSAEFVCHSCDVPSCVNPNHLWIGTQKDNMADASAKGRVKNGRAEITHCPRGHPYSGLNLRINSVGVRECRYCRNQRPLTTRKRTKR